MLFEDFDLDDDGGKFDLQQDFPGETFIVGSKGTELAHDIDDLDRSSTAQWGRPFDDVIDVDPLTTTETRVITEEQQEPLDAPAVLRESHRELLLLQQQRRLQLRQQKTSAHEGEDGVDSDARDVGERTQTEPDVGETATRIEEAPPPPVDVPSPPPPSPPPRPQGKHLCHMCDETFRCKGQLTKHVTTHGPFRCETCGREFRLVANMMRHKVSMHSVPSSKNLALVARCLEVLEDTDWTQK